MTEPMRAKAYIGYKHNMGQGTFETLTSEIGLEVSGRPGESSDELIDRVYGRVEERFIEKFKETLREIEDAKKAK